ncbi:MAG TPA: flagellar hook-length control protein FliK [Marmoricola sp.]|nr:flagellar hook-length control protein FliK [Marmoricola sp.]
MTSLPALPPNPAPAGPGVVLPASGGSGDASGFGAFAGLLLVPGASSAAASAQPSATPGSPATTAPGAELLDGAADDGTEPAPVVDAVPTGVEPSAAQIIAAAQVTPVGPMLANAPRLTPSYAEAAPSTSSPTESSVSAPGSAPFVGQRESATVEAPTTPDAEPVAGRVVASSAMEGQSTPVDAPQGQGSDDSTGVTAAAQGRGSDDSAAGGQAGSQASGQSGGQAGQTSSTQPSSAQPTAAQTSAVAGLTGTGQVTSPEPAGGTAATNPVAGQVFPEVTRLVSRGDGTRRITLQLSPEALGDVRVVLTVRNGEVQVRMSGGEQAQQALLAGAPELHRLLDAAGATSSQIQVGNQSSTTTLGQNPDQHTPQQDAHGQGELRDHQNHRTAGTRDGDTSARDGAPRGTHPHPATNPGTRTRIAGVDVTM